MCVFRVWIHSSLSEFLTSLVLLVPVLDQNQSLLVTYLLSSILALDSVSDDCLSDYFDQSPAHLEKFR